MKHYTEQEPVGSMKFFVQSWTSSPLSARRAPFARAVQKSAVNWTKTIVICAQNASPSVATVVAN